MQSKYDSITQRSMPLFELQRVTLANLLNDSVFVEEVGESLIGRLNKNIVMQGAFV